MTLLGAAAVRRPVVRDALALAPVLVAADGGANLAVAMGLAPERVIGDLDSITPATRAAIPAGRLVHVADQDTTDFEKCLARIDAPFVLGTGFTGARVDHSLAVMNALVRNDRPRCLILSEADVIFAAPPQLDLALPAGTRLSLFPMAEVEGRSEGLKWPIEGLGFAPGGQIGTSNQTTGPVRLSFARPGMLVLLPRRHLRAALQAVVPGFAS